MTRGGSLFITFEGTEGSGKSMQASLLVERLRGAGVPVVATRQPGGTPVGDSVRQLVLLRDDLDIMPRSEALLMCASRAQLVDKVIRPALDRGEVVVCDRFADSTLVYQGAGRNLDMHALASVISFATAGLQPDMTLLLDLPVEIGLVRKRSQPTAWNRFEAETLAFHSRVRDGYLALAQLEPQRWHCCDARQPADQVSGGIWRAVAARLGLTS